eukprot:6672817-Prymnesium_polylepis.1
MARTERQRHRTCCRPGVSGTGAGDQSGRCGVCATQSQAPGACGAAEHLRRGRDRQTGIALVGRTPHHAPGRRVLHA